MSAGKLAIGVKYCGGCNPRWRRTAVEEYLKRDFPEIKLCHGDESLKGEILLLVCGCQTACASEWQPRHPARVVITGPDDYDDDRLRNLLEIVEVQKNGLESGL